MGSGDEIQPSIPAEPTPDGPSGPLLPSPPSETELAPDEPHRRRWPWFVGGAAVLLAIIVIVVVAQEGASEGLPEEVDGLPRLDTEETRTVEDILESVEVGDVQIEVAGYGEGEDPSIILYRYSNLPSQATVQGMLRGAGGGIIGSGGTADVENVSDRQVDGVAYRCISFSGRLFPTDPTEANGLICAWNEGEDVAIVMDTRSMDVDEVVDTASATHEALAS